MINLYAYSYNNEFEKSKETGYTLTKFGDTHREIDVRLAEQGGASEREDKVVIGRWNNVKNIRRDHVLHRVLKRRGLWHYGEGTGAGTEWFKIPGTTPEEIYAYLDQLITEFEGNQVRNSVKLRKLQKRAMKVALDFIKQSNSPSIIANLCPRFGKTIWSLSLFNEITELYGNQVMLLPAYWHGVYSSITTELNLFAEFADIVFIAHNDPNAQQIYNDARAKGLRVIVAMSLHGDVDEWKQKHKWIADIDNSELFVFADEGDFGTHTERQVEKLNFVFDGPVGKLGRFVRVYASGTNVQRLAKCSKDITGVIFTTYSQLEQSESGIVRRRFFNTQVADLKVDVESHGEEVQPSWVKIWAKPLANRAFLSGLMKSLVGDDPLRPELNLSQMNGDTVDVFMLLVSANKKEMDQFKQIAERAIPNYEIVVLNGDETTNLDSEEHAETKINEARLAGKQGVVFVANQMGSRSFSVPEIQATVIAYDRGSVDATIQKVSRCLTPTNKTRRLYDRVTHKTSGMIVDLSFDPNRNENIERLILEEAIMVQRSGETKDFAGAVKFVLNSIDLMRVNSYGHTQEVDEAALFDVFGDNEQMLKVADIAVDVAAALESGVFDILSDVKVGGKNPATKRTIVGKNAKNSVKTDNDDESNQPLTDSERREMNKIINDAIRTINRSVTSVYYLADCNGTSFRDALREIERNETFDAEYRELFGIGAKETLRLLDDRVLNEAILDVIVKNSQPKQVDNLFV